MTTGGTVQVKNSFYEFRIRRVRRSCAHDIGGRIIGIVDVVAAFRHLCANEGREMFMVASLDIGHRIIGVETTAVGTAASVEVHPRETFRGAILAGAVAIVVAHNHPSGDPAPSPNDLELTRRLVSAGELLGIPVLDHVIVTEGGGCCSLRDSYFSLWGV